MISDDNRVAPEPPRQLYEVKNMKSIINIKPFSQYTDIQDFCKKNQMNLEEAYELLLFELQKSEGIN